jgi:hypothetical protein
MKSSRATEEDAAAEQFLSRHLARTFPEDGLAKIFMAMRGWCFCPKRERRQAHSCMAKAPSAAGFWHAPGLADTFAVATGIPAEQCKTPRL